MLVEREGMRAALQSVLDDVVAGHGRLVVLGGEAGAGKTTVTRAFAGDLGAEVPVRRGVCDRLATASVLGPFLEALPELASGPDDAMLRDRLTLFRRLRDVFASAPGLLVIEDVHWADGATLELLRVLGRRIESVRAFVLVTFRDDEVGPEHPLTTVLGDLATQPGVLRMHVPLLSYDGVRRVIEQQGSAADVAEVFRRTGGNPFYVTEVLATGDGAVPATVRDAVLARAARLSDQARRALSAAAVLGAHSELNVLVEVSGEPGEAVDECVRNGVLIASGTVLSFRHELARAAIEQSMSPAERVGLHRHALRVLRAQGAAGRDEGRLAYHAAACGDGEMTLRYAPKAAERTARLGAHREAAELYRLALRVGDPGERQRFELLSALSYECYLTDQIEDAVEARLQALNLAEALDDALAVGVAQRWLSRLSWFFGRNTASEDFAARAIATLEPLGETAELAMAYSNMAQLRMLASDAEPAITFGQRAIDIAHRLGDREVEMHALNNVGTALSVRGEYLQGTNLLSRSLDLAVAAGAEEHAARAYTNLGTLAVRMRRLGDGERCLRAGIAYCEDRDLDSWRLYMSAWLAQALAEVGRYDAAATLTKDVLRHPHLSAITKIPTLVAAAQVAMRTRAFDVSSYLDEALELATQTSELQRLVVVATARAEAAWLDGRTNDIPAAVDLAWQSGVEHNAAGNAQWELGELCWWLTRAGVRRDHPTQIAPPFALLVAEEWSAAAAAWRELGCPLWAAHALACSPDLDDARAALEAIDALRAPAVREAVLRARHAAGLAIPRAPRGAAADHTTDDNPWGLTAREAEILALLAEGLSNAELAERLFLSEKRVGHHVSSILRKSGEPTRSRAVATAQRRRGKVSDNEPS